MNKEYKGFGTPKPRYDPFDNLIVWLPFGIADQRIEGDRDIYTLKREDLSNPENNLTLAGLPVTWSHGEALVSPTSGSKQPDQVGVCSGQWRETGGLFEVEARVTDLTMIRLLEEGFKKSVNYETSACYLSESNGSRYYNHLAIVPEGYARGGRNMTVKSESNANIETQILKPDTITIPIENSTMSQPSPSDIAEQVIASMKTESESFKNIVSEARTEGYAEGLATGYKQAKLLVRAESVGAAIEGDFAEIVKSLIATYLPAVQIPNATPDQEYALAEAAVAVAEAKMAKPEAQAEEDDKDAELKKFKAKKESEISIPESLEVDQSVEIKQESNKTRKISNFLI